MKPAFPLVALLTVLATQPAQAAVEDCMVDTWIADLGDVADMIALQMDGTASHLGGEVAMEIGPDGRFTMLVDDMVINVIVPDVPPMDIKVVGYSAGNLDAADSVFVATVDDYALVGSADILGQTLEIPFTADTGMGGGGTGWYECAGDTLRFEANVGGATDSNRMPRLWSRR